MLSEGILRHWDDAKGYGFIRAERGGADVFVHISAFAVGTRPMVGDRVVFGQVTTEQGGRRRAGEAVVKGPGADASPYRPARPAVAVSAAQGRAAGPGSNGRGKERRPPAARPPRSAPVRDTNTRPLRWSGELLLMLLLTLACLGSAASFVAVSVLPLLAYPVASGAAWLLYGHDKIRAIRGGWRVPEATLHLVELAGGWPGAWVAQQTMRHKTVKASYQFTYWAIVGLHAAFWTLWWLLPEVFAELFRMLPALLPPMPG